MSGYSELKSAINRVIRTNNNREITGQILQNTLNSMVNSLGANYQFAGFATPETEPGTPDQNIFYLTTQPGHYTNFGNVDLPFGLSFLMWKNNEWTNNTLSINEVTKEWVDNNFVSKDYFRQIFRTYDENGVEIFANDTTSIIDNIKAMCGLWTEQYLSALGLGADGGGGTSTLAELNDVQLDNLQDGQALVYNIASNHWVNRTIQSGVDMSVVWAALAANTNEPINASHIAIALSNYVTSANLSTILNDYATKTWAAQNFITVEWFDKLFQLYNGTETEANKIAPNGALPVDQTQLNIEAMFGFWTKKYISALGQGDDGTSYTTLAQLNDVILTNPTADQVLTYNGTHWVNRTLNLGSQTLADLTDVVITSPAANQMLGYDATTQKWKNIAIPATGVTSVALSMPTGFSITGSPITASGTFTVTFASGYSLPTTAKQSNWDTAYGWGNHASAGYALAANLGTASSHAHSDYLTSLSWDSTNKKLAWSKGGTAQTAITIGYASAAGSVAWENVSSHPTKLSQFTNDSGFVTSSGVTSVATGTGLTGGTITTSGTISINSTYQTYISNGNTAYGWGNHANEGYLKVNTDGVLEVGQFIDFHQNNTTGDYSTRLQVLSNNGNTITLPVANGTLALTSDLGSYLPLSGGAMTGTISFNYIGSALSFQQGESLDQNGNVKLGSNSGSWNVFTSGGGVLLRLVQSTAYCGIGNDNPQYKLHVNGNIATNDANGAFMQIGNIRLVYDSTNNAIKVIKSDGTNANFYATGGVSALGVGQESGGGGSYLPLSGGTMTGGNISWNSDSHGLYFHNGCGIEKWSGYGPSLVAEGNNLDFWIRSGTDRSNNAKIIHSGNIGSQSVAYANSAGSVAWGNVSGRPSSMPASDVYAWAKASTKPSYTLDEVPDGSIRKLANYLPLSGGTMSGSISFSQTDGATCLSFVGGEMIDCYGNIRLGANSQTWNVVGYSQTLFTINNSDGNATLAGTLKADTLDAKALELSFSTPFIDFHYNYSSSDYTSRIIESSPGTLTCEASLRAWSYANTSDMRLKNKIKDVEIPLEIIARAPAFQFTWKNPKMGGGYHIGTSAQYWQSAVREFVDVEKDEMGTLSMQYGVAALISAITVARKVMTHEEKIALLETRVSALEKENGEQEMLINSLQEELAKFKAA